MTMLGYEKYSYVQTGSGAAGLAEIDLATELNINYEKGEINGTNFGTAREGWETTKNGLKKVSVDVTSHIPSEDEEDAAFEALDEAYMDNTTVECYVANGPKTGATAVKAVKFVMNVFGGGEKYPKDDMATKSFTLKPDEIPVFGTMTEGVFTPNA